MTHQVLGSVLMATGLALAYAVPWMVVLARAERNTDRALRLAEDLAKTTQFLLDELERRP